MVRKLLQYVRIFNTTDNVDNILGYFHPRSENFFFSATNITMGEITDLKDSTAFF